MPRRRRQRRRAAFQRRHARLQHRLRRVHDARVDVAEGFEREQRRRVLRIVEHIGRRLIDRRDPRAGGGIGLGAGMDGERAEAGSDFVGHGRLLNFANSTPVRRRAQWASGLRLATPPRLANLLFTLKRRILCAPLVKKIHFFLNNSYCNRMRLSESLAGLSL